MLTDLESVFRSLKTDLGLRPVCHQIDRRVEGHLFISVLAYHFVHLPRLQFKREGINDSWQTLREALATQRRVTTTLQRRDGRTVHVRQATRPEPRHHRLATVIGLSPHPGGTHVARVAARYRSVPGGQSDQAVSHHMGLKALPARSALSDALNQRDWRVDHSLAQRWLSA